VVVNLRIFGIFCFEVRQNLVVTVMKKNDSIEASIQVWHIGFVSFQQHHPSKRLRNGSEFKSQILAREACQVTNE